MSRKRTRGSRGGKRVRRGETLAVDREYEILEEEFDRKAAIAHDIYSKVIFEYTGLQALPTKRTQWGHFVVQLPNDWFFELTSPGMDGALMPPGDEEGDGCIFWLVTPDGLYADEESVRFEASDEDMPEVVALYVCRKLWSHFDEIVGAVAAKKLRKGLPRSHAFKIKALVDRGDFEQPPIVREVEGETSG